MNKNILTPLSHDQKMQIAESIIAKNNQTLGKVEKIRLVACIAFVFSAFVFFSFQPVTVITVITSISLFILATIIFN
jgi:hypothetical protein